MEPWRGPVVCSKVLQGRTDPAIPPCCCESILGLSGSFGLEGGFALCTSSGGTPVKVCLSAVVGYDVSLDGMEGRSIW